MKNYSAIKNMLNDVDSIRSDIKSVISDIKSVISSKNKTIKEETLEKSSINVKGIPKFNLCVLPTQNGKTFVAIEQITMEMKQNETKGKSIHIVFTRNRLMDNIQFSKRLSDIELRKKGSVVILSSGEITIFKQSKNIDEVKGLCLDCVTCPDVIVVCSNHYRYDDIFNFVRTIEYNPSNIKRIYLYFDEIHEYIEKVRSSIIQINEYKKLKCITGYTATPSKVWNELSYKNIKLHKLEQYNDINYIGYNDIDFEIIDKPISKTINQYAEYIFDNYDIVNNNSYIFVPSSRKTVEHYEMKSNILKRYKNAIVAVFNCNGKKIYCEEFPSGKDFSKSNLDANQLILEFINTYSLFNRPKFVTGLSCISVGQTLTNETLGSFTSAIISHVKMNTDDIYQLCGRLTGKMKGWYSYKKTRLFCPIQIKNVFNDMETCAVNMIKNYNGEFVSKDMYIEPINDYKVNIEEKEKKEYMFEEFKTQEEAIKFGKSLGFKFNRRKEAIAPSALLDKTGKNPTLEQLKIRKWGLNDKTKARMIPTCHDTWVVYWTK